VEIYLHSPYKLLGSNSGLLRYKKSLRVLCCYYVNEVLCEVSNTAKHRNEFLNCGLHVDKWFRNALHEKLHGENGAEAMSGL